MFLFIILSWMTWLLLVVCETDPKCGLEVNNRKAFEDKIVDYIHVDSKILVIDYNLTISISGNATDWNNISDTLSIEPWRWYRAKGDNVVSFILAFNKIFLSKLFFNDIYVNLQVDLEDEPDGCLSNISRNDIASFIMKELLEDFHIQFEDLRTSAKRYIDALVCTRRKDELDGTAYIWCCKHDLHDGQVCDSFNEFDTMVITTYVIVAIVVWLSYLYSPYLLDVGRTPRTITKIVSSKYIYNQDCSSIKDKEQNLPSNEDTTHASSTMDTLIDVFCTNDFLSEKNITNDSSNITVHTKNASSQSICTHDVSSKSICTKVVSENVVSTNVANCKIISIEENSIQNISTNDVLSKAISTRNAFRKTNNAYSQTISTNSDFDSIVLTNDSSINTFSISDASCNIISQNDSSDISVSTKDAFTNTELTNDDFINNSDINSQTLHKDLFFQIPIETYYRTKQPLQLGLIHAFKTNCSFGCDHDEEDPQSFCTNCEKEIVDCFKKKKAQICRNCKRKCKECCSKKSEASNCRKCKEQCKSYFLRKECSYSKVFFRFLIVFFFFIIPGLVLLIRYYLAGGIRSQIFYCSFPVILSIVIILIVIDSRMYDKITDGFENFSTPIKRYWRIKTCFDWINKCLFPICIIWNSPMVIIVSSLLKCKIETEKKCCKKIWNIIMHFFSLIFTIPASALAFVFVSFVAVSMYKAAFIYSIVSGIVTFLVYIRAASNGIRKKHEQCLSLITEKVKEYISAKNINTDDVHLHFYRINEKPFHYEKGLLTVKASIPFIVMDNNIYVKDLLISHFLRIKIEKLIVFFIEVAAFIGVLILLVIFIGSLDFISPSNQAFIIFFTGIIPLVLKIGYYGTANESDLFFDKEEFEQKLKSYSEEFEERSEKVDPSANTGQKQMQSNNKKEFQENGKDSNQSANTRQQQQKIIPSTSSSVSKGLLTISSFFKFSKSKEKEPLLESGKPV